MAEGLPEAVGTTVVDGLGSDVGVAIWKGLQCLALPYSLRSTSRMQHWPEGLWWGHQVK